MIVSKVAYIMIESKGEFDKGSRCSPKCIVYLLTFLAVILSIGIILSIVVIVFSAKGAESITVLRQENEVDKVIQSIMDEDHPFVAPTRYIVDDKWLMPPSDQKSRGTCWAFAAVFLLESSYRANGITKGFLKPNEYVEFSKQGFGAYIGQHCIADPSIPPCRHGGFAVNSTTDHKTDSLYYFTKYMPGLKESILPVDVCEYYPEEGHDFECDGMDEAIKTNPLKYKITSIEAAKTVEQVKELLVKKQHPIGVGQPLAAVDYYIPCNDTISYAEKCKTLSTKCPIEYGDQMCYKLHLDARTADGVFYYSENYNHSFVYGGHAMDIVGYNDDWIYRTRISSEAAMTPLRGGFVYHNSWRGTGHSVEYLLGRQSEENENVICPNHAMSSNWIPGTEECVRENFKGDLTKCGNHIKTVRGYGIANSVDVLTCKSGVDNAYCSVKRNYVIAAREDASGSIVTDYEPTPYGVDRVRILSWDKETMDDFKSEIIDAVPFHRLPSYFTPEKLVENDPIQCGYYVMPYAVVDMMTKKQWAPLDNYHAVSIDIEWDDQSYARSPASKPFDTSLLLSSTKEWNKTEFDGPLPYQYVY